MKTALRAGLNGSWPPHVLGLDPGIEAAIQCKKRDAAIVALDGRVKPGHDTGSVMLPGIATGGEATIAVKATAVSVWMLMN